MFNYLVTYLLPCLRQTRAEWICVCVGEWIRVEYQFPDFSRYRAVISADGTVLWEPAGVFETSCKIDITFYPYDTQVYCTIWYFADDVLDC